MKIKSLKTVVALQVILFSMSFQTTLVSEVIAACDAYVPAGDSCLTASPIDTTPLDNRVPLILIHGWNQDGPAAPPPTVPWKNFLTYWDKLVRSGDRSLVDRYKPYEFSYKSNSVTLIELGRAFRDVLDQMSHNDPTHFGNNQISIIAHSMGGLIARRFLMLQQLEGAFAGRLGGERVIQLITLGTPHHGSPLANGPSMDAETAEAGPAWWLAWNDFNQLFYYFGGPDFNQPNRSDLHWDNYDGLLDYATYSYERNLALEALNNSTKYDLKIIAYEGAISPLLPICVPDVFDVYCPGATALWGVLGVPSDGLVPLNSAQFDGHGVIRGLSRFFNEYNHEELRTGKGDNDTLLFGQIRNDLLTSFQTPHLLDSSKSVPEGFGASYDVLSQEKDLFLKILSTSGGSSRSSTTFYVVNRGTPANQFQVTWAGNGNSPAGYQWTGASWISIPLDGGTPFKDSQGKEYPEWRVGAMFTTMLSSAIQSDTNYAVAYVCTWTGAEWKCGCHDSSCAQNFWQLQAWPKQ